MTKLIQVQVLSGPGFWIVRFPDLEILAKNRSMVRALIKAYGEERHVTAYPLWDDTTALDKLPKAIRDWRGVS